MGCLKKKNILIRFGKNEITILSFKVVKIYEFIRRRATGTFR